MFDDIDIDEKDVKRIYEYIREAYKRNDFMDEYNGMPEYEANTEERKKEILFMIKYFMKLFEVDKPVDLLKHLYEHEEGTVELLKNKRGKNE